MKDNGSSLKIKNYHKIKLDLNKTKLSFLSVCQSSCPVNLDTLRFSGSYIGGGCDKNFLKSVERELMEIMSEIPIKQLENFSKTQEFCQFIRDEIKCNEYSGKIYYEKFSGQLFAWNEKELHNFVSKLFATNKIRKSPTIENITNYLNGERKIHKYYKLFFDKQNDFILIWGKKTSSEWNKIITMEKDAQDYTVSYKCQPETYYILKKFLQPKLITTLDAYVIFDSDEYKINVTTADKSKNEIYEILNSFENNMVKHTMKFNYSGLFI